MKVTILYGSETGNAESLAELTCSRLNRESFEASYISMEDVHVEDLPHFETLLIITSTWGDGEPPTNAYVLWEELSKRPSIDLRNTRFAVLALGDTAYPEFCKCGRDFDQWLGELGGRRMLERVDCDVDYEEPYANWMDSLLHVLKSQPVA